MSDIVVIWIVYVTCRIVVVVHDNCTEKYLGHAEWTSSNTPCLQLGQLGHGEASAELWCRHHCYRQSEPFLVHIVLGLQGHVALWYYS